MAVGLGLTSEEWQDLRSQVDDSFWVMRVIGGSPFPKRDLIPEVLTPNVGYPPLPNDYDGFSCGAHK